MSQKLPVNDSEWTEDTSQFNEDFIKNCNEESDEGYFLKVISKSSSAAGRTGNRPV